MRTIAFQLFDRRGENPGGQVSTQGGDHALANIIRQQFRQGRADQGHDAQEGEKQGHVQVRAAFCIHCSVDSGQQGRDAEAAGDSQQYRKQDVRPERLEESQGFMGKAFSCSGHGAFSDAYGEMEVDG